MIGTKSETEDFLFPIRENRETLKKQTHRKAEETLKYKLTRPKKISHLNHQSQPKDVGLLDYQVYKYAILFLL